MPTAKAQFGEGAPATYRWQEQARDALLSEGWLGILRVIDAMRTERGSGAATGRVGRPLGYHCVRMRSG